MNRHYFSITELTQSQIASERGIVNEPGPEALSSLRFTLAGLDRIRAWLGHPVQVNSGYRCAELNQLVGGSKDSQHMKGEAADIICPAFGTPADIAEDLGRHMEVLGIDQLILEGTWVHVSFTLEPRYRAMTFKGGKYLPGIVRT